MCCQVWRSTTTAPSEFGCGLERVVAPVDVQHVDQLSRPRGGDQLAVADRRESLASPSRVSHASSSPGATRALLMPPARSSSSAAVIALPLTEASVPVKRPCCPIRRRRLHLPTENGPARLTARGPDTREVTRARRVSLYGSSPSTMTRCPAGVPQLRRSAGSAEQRNRRAQRTTDALRAVGPKSIQSAAWLEGVPLQLQPLARPCGRARG